MSVATNVLTQEKPTLKTIKNTSLLQKSKTEVVRSPFFYVGDKYKIYSQISKYFPAQITTFIEPFTGGGSVFLNTNAKKYILNDIDSYLIQLHAFLAKSSSNSNEFFYKMSELILDSGLSHSYIKDVVPNELKKEFKKTYYSRYNKNSYLALRDKFNSNKSDMLLLYVLLIYGFNRMLRFNGKGDFNLPVGNVDLNKNVINALNNYFSIVKDKNISFFNQDFESFLSNIEYAKGDFVYLDPPYLITFSEYNKFWNKSEEKRLLLLLDELDRNNVSWAISNMVSNNTKGTYNQIFAKWMKKYNVHQISSNYISFNNNTIKPNEEVLVTNYE